MHGVVVAGCSTLHVLVLFFPCTSQLHASFFNTKPRPEVYSSKILSTWLMFKKQAKMHDLSMELLSCVTP